MAATESPTKDDMTQSLVMNVCKDILAPIVRADGGEMYLVSATIDEPQMRQRILPIDVRALGGIGRLMRFARRTEHRRDALFRFLERRAEGSVCFQRDLFVHFPKLLVRRRPEEKIILLRALAVDP